MEFIPALFANVDPVTAALLGLVLWRIDRRLLVVENKFQALHEAVLKRKGD